jgi:uncharacterized protein YggT (Ycf19 family)
VGIVCALFSVFMLLLRMVQMMIFASVLASWMDADPGNRFVKMIQSVTDPIYRLVSPVTRHIPGPLDWAPFFVLLLIVFFEKIGGYYSIQLGCRI